MKLPDGIAAWRRIHIIGGPGSGKTTLARQIAVHYAVPVYDLDAIAYEGGAGAKRTLTARVADVRAIAARPGWVTEGAFLWWTDDLFRTADAIVWLDLRWRIAAWRVLLRHMRASLAGTNRHRGIRKLVRFLFWTRRYYRAKPPPTAPDDDLAMSGPATVAALLAHTGKVVRCRHPREVVVLLAAIRGK